MKLRWACCLALMFLGVVLGAVPEPMTRGHARGSGDPLQILVMDPLALPLSCACVKGTGQRDYDALAEHLSGKLGREVRLTFDESLALALPRMEARPDLIIGKQSIVLADASDQQLEVRPLARLTGPDGRTDLTGVFLCRTNVPATRVQDLAGTRIALGPKEDEEANRAARAALRAAGLLDKVTLSVEGSMDAAAVAVADGEADVAVVSDFLPVLLEGCGKVDRGTTRVIGHTDPVPFITVFATPTVSPTEEDLIAAALRAVAHNADLLRAMESRDGFVRAGDAEPVGWTDWRGPGRTGLCDSIPRVLPENPEVLWRVPMTGPALAGIAATTTRVVVPDKDADFTKDIFLCLNADTGAELWRLEYEAAGKVDYSNAPRATPVIHGGLVFVQGALGDLHCVELATGEVVWRRNIVRDFDAEPLTWGSSSPPLVVDDLLILNPGARDASVVALKAATGELVWKTPGHAAAYSAFVIGTFAGKQQIVGYDCGGLGGWNPITGRRLWEMIPPDGADFNVTTPVILGERILLATENNGTRLYQFNDDGTLKPDPVLRNDELAPDTCTPVVINGKVYATAYGEMYCLDLEDGLQTVWVKQADMFYDHTSVMAGNDRVLVWTMSGDLLLLRAEKSTRTYDVISHLRPFGKAPLDSMSHPAIVGDRLYLRSKSELLCLRIDGSD